MYPEAEGCTDTDVHTYAQIYFSLILGISLIANMFSGTAVDFQCHVGSSFLERCAQVPCTFHGVFYVATPSVLSDTLALCD